MSDRRAGLLLAASIAALAPPPRGLAAEAPDWLRTAMKAPAPAVSGRAPGVVLLEEELVDATRAEVRSRVREAVRILTVEGQRGYRLLAHQSIDQDFKLIGAWKVRPDGHATTYGAKDVAQHDADGRHEFSLSKLRVFWPEEARVGDVVGWEFQLKRKPEALVDRWIFGWNRPALVSRFGLKVPGDWTVRSDVANGPDLPGTVNDDGYRVWEMRALEPIKEEAMGPPRQDLLPSLLVAYGPDAGDSRRFDTWEAVSRWYAGLFWPQVVSDGPLRETAAALSGGASKLDAVRAVSRFVQGIRYLDVAPGRSMVEPHPAPQILKNRFGDCEDKAVLAAALLREIGVAAHPVLALTSDSGSVVTEFPAPNQFNHAILAIEAPPGADLASTVEVDGAGRLVIFDPTSTLTGLGDLPHYLQGTHAVLADARGSGLLTLPVIPPEASRRESDLRVTFSESERGGVDVGGVVTYTGQYAAGMRAHYEVVRGEKRVEELRSWIAGHYGHGEVRSLDVTGVEAPGESVVKRIDLWMPLPGKDLGDVRTMLAHFALGTRAERLEGEARAAPVRVTMGYQEIDRATIAVPAGWRLLDPLPSARASGPLGEYRLTARLEGRSVLVERSLTVRAGTVPVPDYQAARRFLDEVFKGDGLGLAFQRLPEEGA